MSHNFLAVAVLLFLCAFGCSASSHTSYAIDGGDLPDASGDIPHDAAPDAIEAHDAAPEAGPIECDGGTFPPNLPTCSALNCITSADCKAGSYCAGCRDANGCGRLGACRSQQATVDGACYAADGCRGDCGLGCTPDGHCEIVAPGTCPP